jgi:small subunit ribosomal protein S6
MNTYDLTIVLDGKLTPAKKKAAVEKLEKIVTLDGGTLGKVNDWGKRELAYPIKKITTGIYLTFPVTIGSEAVKRLNDKLRLEEEYLRYLLIKADKSVGVETEGKPKRGRKKSE